MGSRYFCIIDILISIVKFGEKWKTYTEASYEHYSNSGGLKKNPLAIARSLKSALEDGVRSTILTNLVNSIVDYAITQ